MSSKGLVVIHAVLIALTCALLMPLPATASSGCQAVTATLTAHLVLGPEGPYWSGQSYLRFGNSEEIINGQYHSLVGPPPLPNAAGVTRHEETFVTDVPGFGSFTFHGAYTGAPGPTPYVMNLHETGSLDPSAGTGAFAGKTGTFTIQGPYVTVFPLPPSEDRPWFFIGAMTGVICDP